MSRYFTKSMESCTNCFQRYLPLSFVLCICAVGSNFIFYEGKRGSWDNRHNDGCEKHSWVRKGKSVCWRDNLNVDISTVLIWFAGHTSKRKLHWNRLLCESLVQFMEGDIMRILKWCLVFLSLCSSQLTWWVLLYNTFLCFSFLFTISHLFAWLLLHH